MQLYSIEGNRQRLDGGAMFGNAPRELWERWHGPDDRNRIDLACRCLLVRDGDRWVLLDAGVGVFFDPVLRDRYGVVEDQHMLLVHLADVGIEHTDIEVVVLSHLHFDHAGGLLTPWHKRKPYELLFPNATYVLSRPAWERANAPHARDKASFVPQLSTLLAESGRLELVDDTSYTLGPDFEFHRSDGHTPGLLLTELRGERGPVVFASDLVPGRAWVHKSITMGYDRFPELLLDEKVRLLDDMVERGGRLFFTHDPSCTIADITCDERGRYGSRNAKAQLRGEEA